MSDGNLEKEMGLSCCLTIIGIAASALLVAILPDLLLPRCARLVQHLAKQPMLMCLRTFISC
jgi:hypothetical protein